MSERCGSHGPEPDTCLLPPGHEGWHKSNFYGWPNEAESLARWAEIGRRIILGEPMSHLSRREIEWALDAFTRFAD